LASLIDILAMGIYDVSGAALSGGTVETFHKDRTTKKPIYSDAGLSTALANPATLDAAGRVIAYTDSDTSIIAKDSKGSVVKYLDVIRYKRGLITSDEISSASISSRTISGMDGDGIGQNIDGSLFVKTDGVTSTISAGKLSHLVAAHVANFIVSGESGGYVNSTTTETDITNLSCTITTNGRPVILMFFPFGLSRIIMSEVTTGVATATIRLYRGATVISRQRLGIGRAVASSASITYPGSIIFHIDKPAAGTYTYRATGQAGNADVLQVTNTSMVAIEI